MTTWIKSRFTSERAKWHILDPSPKAKNQTYCQVYTMHNEVNYEVTNIEPNKVCLVCDPSKRFKK